MQISASRNLAIRLARKPELLIFSSTLVTAFLSAFYLLSRNPYSLLYYGDAISHLVISRKVIDWITPGIAQLGTVWLPLPHIMMLPFIWNNYLFHTGLAGTIVSALSMAVTNTVLFRIVKFQFSSTKAGVFASVLYLMNPSVLYMGIIPMTEAPFTMFFVLCVYYLQQWFFSSSTWKEYRNLLKCALTVSFATLTRYEAWVLPFGLIIVVLLVMTIMKREVWKVRREAFIVVAIAYSSLGAIGWILWNAAIFRDPLAFVDSPYSAQNQALVRPFRAHLFLQPLNSLRVMGEVAVSMYGIQVLVLSLVGVAAYLAVRWKAKQTSFGMVMIAALLAPFFATFAAMVEGSGEIYPVQVGDNLGYFNGRFLVFLAPFIVFCCVALVMSLARRKNAGYKAASVVLAVLIVIAFGYTFIQQPLVFGKTTSMNGTDPFPLGSSTGQADLQVAKELGSAVHSGHVVMYVASGDTNEIMLLSNMDLKSFIAVGSGIYWNTSETFPWVYGTFLVWTRQPNGEIQSLYSYWQANATILLEHYQLIYQNAAYDLFQNRTVPDYSLAFNGTVGIS